jgi:hypothetical protein
VIDHEIYRHERFDNFRIALESADRRTHSGKVDQQGNTREILEKDSGDDEWNLLGPFGSGTPVCQSPDVVLGYALAVAVAQDRFEHYANRDWQLRDRSYAFLFQLRERIEPAGAPGRRVKALKGVE